VNKPDFFPDLVAELKADEGCKLNAYPDPISGGEPFTIGYGHTGPNVHPGTTWTQAQADIALELDVYNHGMDLEEALPWIAHLDPVRRRVLWNMAFNIGVEGLLGFKNTLAMVKSGNYVGAVGGMMASKWARQVPNRAKRLARHMETGL
jgi:lysozyme